MTITISVENLKLVVQCLYGIAGVIAVIGAFNVYIVMNNDQENVWKPIVKTIAATVALFCLAAALENIYAN